MEQEQVKQDASPQQAVPTETTGKTPEPPQAEPMPSNRIIVEPIPEVVAQLPTDLQEAVKAGAPIVIIMGENCRIRAFRTFEKGTKFSRAEKITDEEAQALKQDFHDLLDTHTFIQDRVKEMDKDWNKLFQENKRLKKENDARKEAWKNTRAALKEISDRNGL